MYYLSGYFLNEMKVLAGCARRLAQLLSFEILRYPRLDI